MIKSTKVLPGEGLSFVAKRVFGDWTRYKEFPKWNAWITDPDKTVLEPGDEIFYDDGVPFQQATLPSMYEEVPLPAQAPSSASAPIPKVVSSASGPRTSGVSLPVASTRAPIGPLSNLSFLRDTKLLAGIALVLMGIVYVSVIGKKAQ